MGLYPGHWVAHKYPVSALPHLEATTKRKGKLGTRKCMSSFFVYPIWGKFTLVSKMPTPLSGPAMDFYTVSGKKVPLYFCL